MQFKHFAGAAACVLASFLPAHAATPPITEQDAYEIGVDAYNYLYPLVTMELTRRQVTNVPKNGVVAGRGPANTLIQMRAYPDGSYRDVVRPNFDTLYSFSWLDLRREPMLISVPENQKRYYLMPLLDMWSEVFASPGSRTSGDGAHTFAVVAPGWRGKLPANVERIDATTSVVLMAGRSQTNGVADYSAVHAFQDGMRITPLSQWGKPAAAAKDAPVDPAVDMATPPKKQANQLPAAQFYKLAAQLMGQHPAHATDQPMLARLKRIGFAPGKAFDLAAQSPEVQRALEKSVPDGQRLMQFKLAHLAVPVNGWVQTPENIGNFGNSYVTRALIAATGLGANPPEDSVYAFAYGDAAGKPLNGSSRYTIHFAKGEVPPARAFWSVTLYDNESFPVPNPQKRSALSDLSGELKPNADGSLTLYVQADSPGAALESNWLPAPRGPFNLTMRAYYPKPALLTGTWHMPGVVKTAD